MKRIDLSSIVVKVAMFAMAMFLFVPEAFALQTQPPGSPSDVIVLAGAIFAALTGVPGFIASLINLLKLLKVVTDGSAPTWSFWLNIIAYAGVFIAVTLGKTNILAPIDAAFGQLAGIISHIIILLGGAAVSMAMTAFWHRSLKAGNVPLLGTSYNKK